MNRFADFTDRELLVLGLAMDSFAEQVARSEEPHTTLFHEWASEAGKRRNARDLAKRAVSSGAAETAEDPIGYDMGEAQDALSWEKGGPTS